LPTGADIADPVAVITAAETRGQEILDSAIGSLAAAQTAIQGGAPAAVPTFNDATGLGLRFIGINENDAGKWTRAGSNTDFTVTILLKRLRGMRSIVGGGGVFYTCLGPATGTLGACAPGNICNPATVDAATCGFRTALCVPFWTEGFIDQVDTIVHESAHTFGDFVGDAGREGNAACYARCAETIAGVSPPPVTNTCAAPAP
jgi:hypothetical protein